MTTQPAPSLTAIAAQVATRRRPGRDTVTGLTVETGDVARILEDLDATAGDVGAQLADVAIEALAAIADRGLDPDDVVNGRLAELLEASAADTAATTAGPDTWPTHLARLLETAPAGVDVRLVVPDDLRRGIEGVEDLGALLGGIARATGHDVGGTAIDGGRTILEFRRAAGPPSVVGDGTLYVDPHADPAEWVPAALRFADTCSDRTGDLVIPDEAMRRANLDLATTIGGLELAGRRTVSTSRDDVTERTTFRIGPR